MRFGADKLVPLSASGKDGKPRWSLQGSGTIPYLAYSEQSGLGRIIASQAVTRDRAIVFDKVFTSHLAATLLSMVRAGHGIAWLPRTLAEEDLAAGLLVEAGKEELTIPIEIRLFRPAARQKPDVESVWSAFERS